MVTLLRQIYRAGGPAFPARCLFMLALSPQNVSIRQPTNPRSHNQQLGREGGRLQQGWDPRAEPSERQGGHTVVTERGGRQAGRPEQCKHPRPNQAVL